MVVSHLMGFPAANRDQLRQWEEVFALRVPMLDRLPPFALQAGDRLRSYFGGLIEERRRRPSDDLITQIATAELDGEDIGDAALGMVFILLPSRTSSGRPWRRSSCSGKPSRAGVRSSS